MASRTTAPYAGATSDLQRRVLERKKLVLLAFTLRYWITRLVHFESNERIEEATSREKQIEG
ncbi:GIY-YIG nuclease family protein [Panacagrimonas sp.]|uniref:GIY-YIG nuclease family protein n=1 Tax=Panacagrimonas sp. TaxID=2480088 RepID=UPI003B51DA74